MVIPRRAKTKPYLDVVWAMRIAAGRVIVIPTPTAEPCIAAMVGLRQRWIARAMRPPLFIISAGLFVVGMRWATYPGIPPGQSV